jgi:hypothetical protein
LQNSIWSQIYAFNVGFEFFANRLWPVGYVNLRKNEPTSKSSNLALKASFAKASWNKKYDERPTAQTILEWLEESKNEIINYQPSENTNL